MDLKKIKESIVIYEHSNYEELMKEEQITEVNHKKNFRFKRIEIAADC